MRRQAVAGAIILAVLVVGCDREAKTFGRSYDECILKNANSGGDADSRTIATTICKRRFVRSPKPEEIALVTVGVKLQTIKVGSTPVSDSLVVHINNNSPNFEVAGVNISVEFYEGPIDKNPDQEPIESGNWELDAAIPPNGSGLASMVAGLDTAIAPSRYFKVTSAGVSKVLPVGGDD